MGDPIAVFFDIGDTLAGAVVQGGALARLEPYPFVREVLVRIRTGPDGMRRPVGLISNTGHESGPRLFTLLVEAGLAELVDRELCLFSSVEGLDKSQPAFFTLAATRAGRPAAQCLFVGEDAAERALATSAGLRVSPHPLHALHLMESAPAHV
jgi:FMN phosphatase YigB (HAD superfamily)